MTGINNNFDKTSVLETTPDEVVILEVLPKIKVGVHASIPPVTSLTITPNDDANKELCKQLHGYGKLELTIESFDKKGFFDSNKTRYTTTAKISIHTRGFAASSFESASYYFNYSVDAIDGKPIVSDQEIQDEILYGWNRALIKAGFAHNPLVAENILVSYLLTIGSGFAPPSAGASEVVNIIPDHLGHKPTPTPPEPIIPIINPQPVGTPQSVASNFSVPVMSTNFWDNLNLPKAIVIASVAFLAGAGMFAFANIIKGEKNDVEVKVARFNGSSPSNTLNTLVNSHSDGGRHINTQALGATHAEQVNSVLKQMGVDLDKPADMGCLVE